MSGRIHRNADWDLPKSATLTWEQASFAVLLDIRGELRNIHRLLACRNALDIPGLLRDIKENTAKPKRRKAVKK
jgi:hypothetical protein